jgi:putative drug exporter of the RND superfamily
VSISPRGLTGHVTRAAARRPWLTIFAWLGILALALYLASGLGDVLTTDASFTNTPESQRGWDLIAERLAADEPLQEIVIVSSNTLSVDEPQFQGFVEQLVADLRAQDQAVAGVLSYYEIGEESLVARDRSALMIPVQMRGEWSEAQRAFPDYLKVIEAADGVSGFETVTGGDLSLDYVFTHTAERDLQTGEMIGLPIALVILVVVFGALVIAGVPILLAAFTILVSIGITALVGQFFELSFFVINMIVMLGLALGIDYSLFIAGRYREELRRYGDRLDALTRAGDTASKAVLFSGLAVVIALTGMLLVPSTIFKSLGTGAIIVAALSVLATLTLLPAVLMLMGNWVNRGQLPFQRAGRSAEAAEGGFWAAIARVVMRRPVVSVVVTSLVLLGLASVYLTIDLGQSGIGSLPQNTTVYRTFTMLNERFASGSVDHPTEIVIDAPDVSAPGITAAIEDLQARLAADGSFGESWVVANGAGNLAVVNALYLGDNQSSAALSSVERVRGELVPQAFAGVPANVYVTGPTALTIDFNQMVTTYTPIVFAVVLGISFLLLLLAFRSIVVPAKAIVMNLMSVGASYGLLVLVFQHGVGNEIFGFQEVERIETWVPLLMFTILFGLSMDYHVFLLSRIRERFDQTGNNFESVAYGVRTTARIITGAAAIMVAVFSGFAMGDLVMFQQMGFGLAVAVILDATIIRSVLVPSSMALLGNRNWYLPSWLNWLPHINVEGMPEEPETATPMPGVAVTGD